VILAIRAQHLASTARAGTVAIAGRVALAEISGSHTYLHVASERLSLIAQLPGVQQWALGAPCTLHVDPRQVYCFDARGQLLVSPQWHA
jgi:glycerol transport system ATP-binding protein